ncbi:hypothetical protein KKB99_04280 [bacterium]|nr:hypothetical protein [bacterium]MBU1025211.1 hypothetical protein [bacterium]
MIMQRSESDLRTLITLVEMKARDYDGHLTIMRFSTEWKAMLGTPNLDTGEGRNQVRTIKGYESLEQALLYLIIEGQGA